jgi:hypothetical protein
MITEYLWPYVAKYSVIMERMAGGRTAPRW